MRCFTMHIMKKSAVYLSVVLFVILSIVSCTFLGWGVAPSDTTDGTDATTGTLVINLGSSGRTIYEASEESTVRYLVEITGPDDYSYSRTITSTAESVKIQLKGGVTYTVTIIAVNGAGIQTAWVTKAVPVNVGEIATPEFIFEEKDVELTDYYLWNKSGSSPLSYYLLKKEATPSSLEVNRENGIGASCSAFTEDKDGNWYTLSDDGDGNYTLYQHSEGNESYPLIMFFSDSKGRLLQDGLYYDYTTNYLWVFTLDAYLLGYDLSYSEERDDFDFEARLSGFDRDDHDKWEMYTFAVYGDRVYAGYNYGGTRSLGRWNKADCTMNLGVSEMARTINVDTYWHSSDIAVINDKVYVLFNDNSDEVNFVGWDFEKNSILSRGTLVELDLDELQDKGEHHGEVHHQFFARHIKNLNSRVETQTIDYQ